MTQWAKGAVALAELSGGWGWAAPALVPGLTGAGAAERRPCHPLPPTPSLQVVLAQARPGLGRWQGGASLNAVCSAEV